MLWIIIGSAIGGFLIGIGISQAKHRPIGTLRIDHFNPEKDVYRFEIDDLDSLNRKREILLKVDHHADFSQK